MTKSNITHKLTTPAAVSGQQDLLSEPVDVLVLTNKPDILPQVANMLSSRGLNYRKMPVDAFCQVKGKLHLIGTTVIDASGLSLSQQKNLHHIIDALEEQNIAAILLNSWVEFETGSVCPFRKTLFGNTRGIMGAHSGQYSLS